MLDFYFAYYLNLECSKVITQNCFIPFTYMCKKNLLKALSIIIILSVVDPIEFTWYYDNVFLFVILFYRYPVDGHKMATCSTGSCFLQNTNRTVHIIPVIFILSVHLGNQIRFRYIVSLQNWMKLRYQFFSLLVVDVRKHCLQHFIHQLIFHSHFSFFILENDYGVAVPLINSCHSQELLVVA